MKQLRILAVSHPCVVDVNQKFYAELEALGNSVELVVPSNFVSDYANGPIQVKRFAAFRGALHEEPTLLNKSIPMHAYTRKLDRIVDKFDPEVLLVEEEPYAVSAWQSFRASGRRTMVRAIYSAQNMHKRYPLPFSWMEQFVLRKADIALSVSEEVTSVLRAKGFLGQIVDFPLGVDTDQFRPDAIVRSKMRHDLGIGNNEVVVGYVGRFVEEKGIQLLLDAARETKNEGVHFLFVGNGPLVDDIRALQDELGLDKLHVALSVPHSEVQAWLQAMDLVALPSRTTPSWKEQFGRVIVEANACSVPVLGSDSGEIPRLIAKTGGGWTFREGDLAAFLDVLRHMAANPEARWAAGRNGHDNAISHFAKRNLARRTNAVLLEKHCTVRGHAG